MKKLNLKKLTVLLVIAIAIATVGFLVRDIFSAADAKAVMKILCDGFFIGGALIICAGLLVFCSNEGAYDSMSYGLATAFGTRRFSGGKDIRPAETFEEYKQRKHSTKTTVAEFFVAGGAVVLLGLAFYLGYRLV